MFDNICKSLTENSDTDENVIIFTVYWLDKVTVCLDDGVRWKSEDHQSDYNSNTKHNVWTRFNGNKSNSCWNVSLKTPNVYLMANTTVTDRKASRSIKSVD